MPSLQLFDSLPLQTQRMGACFLKVAPQVTDSCSFIGVVQLFTNKWNNFKLANLSVSLYRLVKKLLEIFYLLWIPKKGNLN